ncbi:MAG: hypothetical protein GY928_08280, partial [Colwellia sp.]|nr:hypothetical protein [Colwellia sp.]
SLELALKRITCNALERLPGDTASIEMLNKRCKVIDECNLPTLDKIYTLLEDCKRFGTLAFSHAARAGFIATSLLKSFIENGMLAD